MINYEELKYLIKKLEELLKPYYDDIPPAYKKSGKMDFL